MARLVQANKNAMVTQITTQHTRDEQKRSSECTIPYTLRQNSIKPHRVSLLSARNMNLTCSGHRFTENGQLKKDQEMLIG